MKYSYDITTSLKFDDEIFDYAYDLMQKKLYLSSYTALGKSFYDYYGSFEANLFEVDSKVQGKIILDFNNYTKKRCQGEEEKLDNN